MLYYLYFNGAGRAALAGVFQAQDPFTLKPAVIVERILAVGHKPAIDKPSITRWPTIGVVYPVERADQVFILALSRSSQRISLQEVRTAAYLPSE